MSKLKMDLLLFLCWTNFAGMSEWDDARFGYAPDGPREINTSDDAPAANGRNNRRIRRSVNLLKSAVVRSRENNSKYTAARSQAAIYFLSASPSAGLWQRGRTRRVTAPRW